MKKLTPIISSTLIIAIFAFNAVIGMGPMSVASAQTSVQAQTRTLTTQTPPVNPNKDTFRLVACDGPANLNHINPATGAIDQGYERDKANPVQFKKDFGHEPPFVACDFNGIMIQVQHLINVMLVVGVLVSIAMMTWAGALYISGDPGKKKQAHAIFPKIGIGFILMLSAWFIVYQLLTWLIDNDGFRTLLGTPS